MRNIFKKKKKIVSKIANAYNIHNNFKNVGDLCIFLVEFLIKKKNKIKIQNGKTTLKTNAYLNYAHI